MRTPRSFDCRADAVGRRWMCSGAQYDPTGLLVSNLTPWFLDFEVASGAALSFAAVQMPVNLSSSTAVTKLRVVELYCRVFTRDQPGVGSMSTIYPTVIGTLPSFVSSAVSGTYVGPNMIVPSFNYGVPSVTIPTNPVANVTSTLGQDTTTGSLLVQPPPAISFGNVTFLLPNFNTVVPAFAVSAPTYIISPAGTAPFNFPSFTFAPSTTMSLAPTSTGVTTITRATPTSHGFGLSLYKSFGFPVIGNPSYNYVVKDPLNQAADAAYDFLDLVVDWWALPIGLSIPDYSREWSVKLPCPIDLSLGEALMVTCSAYCTDGCISPFVIFVRARVEEVV